MFIANCIEYCKNLLKLYNSDNFGITQIIILIHIPSLLCRRSSFIVCFYFRLFLFVRLPADDMCCEAAAMLTNTLDNREVIQAFCTKFEIEVFIKKVIVFEFKM